MWLWGKKQDTEEHHDACYVAAAVGEKAHLGIEQ